jgi:hypothetical protein
VDRLLAIGQLVDMVGAGPVDVPVVEVVDMVVMWDGGVPTPLVVDMAMVVDRRVIGARNARPSGSVVHAPTVAEVGASSTCSATPSLAYP